ncbi:MAG: hypothetical protein KJ804_04295 [Proteobacteria bacterium]|nr:hypothetical protein [Pseudomonadota bacterium]MBU1057525.1 hypothetical protein [Pseudomonadota bacterium]
MWRIPLVGIPPVALSRPSITVLDVSMPRTATTPYTFTAAESPLRFFFSELWFGNDGYMTQGWTFFRILPYGSCSRHQPSKKKYKEKTSVLNRSALP